MAELSQAAGEIAQGQERRPDWDGVIAVARDELGVHPCRAHAGLHVRGCAEAAASGAEGFGLDTVVARAPWRRLFI